MTELLQDENESDASPEPEPVGGTLVPDPPVVSPAPEVRIHGMRLFQGDGEGPESVVPLNLLQAYAIRHALQVTNMSVGRAAKLLGIGRATLYRRIKDLGILMPPPKNVPKKRRSNT